MMKKLLFLLIPALILSSCHEPDDSPTGEYEFYITGYKAAFTVDFNSGSRVDNSAPDDVHHLHFMVIDGQNQVVYEQYYYDYDDIYYLADMDSATTGDPYWNRPIMPGYGIPDTLFIPKLPAGNYQILAATSYIETFDYRYGNETDPSGSTGTSVSPRLSSYTVSDGPIYVGKKSILLDENNKEVVLNMSNVSAKITLKNQSNATNLNGWLEMMFETRNNKYYSFSDGLFHLNNTDYDEPVYTYLDYTDARSFYVLPKGLSAVKLNFYDYYTGFNFSQSVPLDPRIDLNPGDAITFNVNLEDIYEGAGTGAFKWDTINWNDLGEVTIP